MGEETKNGRFHRLARFRTDMAVQKIGQLENLTRSDYESTEAERRSYITKLEFALDALRSRWRLSKPAPVGRITKTLEAPQVPARASEERVSGLDAGAEGGATVRSEIAWALDAMKRGDHKLAENRLRRCLQ